MRDVEKVKCDNSINASAHCFFSIAPVEEVSIVIIVSSPFNITSDKRGYPDKIFLFFHKNMLWDLVRSALVKHF